MTKKLIKGSNGLKGSNSKDFLLDVSYFSAFSLVSLNTLIMFRQHRPLDDKIVIDFTAVEKNHPKSTGMKFKKFSEYTQNNEVGFTAEGH